MRPLAALLTLPLCAQSAPDSIARVADLAHLPRLEPGVVCRQFASTDPSGRGVDHGHYVRKNGDRWVLAEMDGPGVVVRIWSTNPAGTLWVTLDGEPGPRIACAFADLFDGNYAPFCEPLATRTSGGAVSYFPIPFRRSCRIEVGGLADPQALYYQVQYLTYPEGTPLRTFTRELPAAELLALAGVKERFARRAPLDEAKLERVGTGTPSGKLRDFVTVTGSGHVRELQALIVCHQMYERGVLLEVRYDGEEEPSIRVPLLDAFGLGFVANTEAAGWIAGRQSGRGYLRLPLPFRTGIRIGLRNLTQDDAFNYVTALVEKGPVDASEGYLHGEFRCVDRLQERAFRWAQVEGRGKLVGVSMALQGVGSLWYLEGHEAIAVDGESRPRIAGTGTEDFFNGGGYWDRGTFQAPFWGLDQKEEGTSNRTMPWRFFVPDAIPFEKGLVAEIEQGSAGRVRDTYYSSVAWWYGAKPSAVRAVTREQASVPRIWVAAQPGWQPAIALEWSGDGEPRYQRFEEFTSDHRSLERPLHQAFPESHVEADGAPRDARAVVLARAAAPGAWRATVEATHADRFWVDLRAHFACMGDELWLDGKRLGALPPDTGEPGPRSHTFGPVSLRRGRHELAVVAVPGDHVLALDALRLRTASPFVKQYWLGPVAAATPGLTVEEAPEVERSHVARGFDPELAGWKRVAASGDGIDLARELTSRAPVFGYASFVVEAKEARTARVLLGSDDGVRVWLDGRPVWTHAVHRPVAPDQDAFDVELHEGTNRFLVKVRNDAGGFALVVRVCTP